MALGRSLLTLVWLCGFGLGTASVGNGVLRKLRLELQSDAEYLLVAIAIGITVTETLICFVLCTMHIRWGCFAIAILLCFVSLRESKAVSARVSAVLRRMIPGTPLNKYLTLLIAVVVSLEFLASQAPLTGSDALNYHFSVPKQILQEGFHPLFSNSHSFLCGQHHLLILFGLALAGEQLALGFIFLGGVLAAGSLACLASRWVPDTAVLTFSLIFLLTPIVFWQITLSGSPDIYMAFFVSAAIIVLNQRREVRPHQEALLAGLLAGAVAGAKYTGCFLAAAIALAFILEFKTILGSLIFFFSTLLSGIWPYLRNLVWTGNPVFPFLSARLSPHLITTYALSDMASDTGASAHHHLAQLLPFVLLAAAQKNSLGLYDFFGPTVLIFAPPILFSFRNERLWRTSTSIWFLSSIAIFFSSGLPRFLLPIFPTALSCASAGWQLSSYQKGVYSRRIIAALLTLIVLFGAIGLVLYTYTPILVAIGFQDKTKYLEDRGPDFQIARATNEVLATQVTQLRREKALVFIRHSYYLNIPFLNGDPARSFEVDVERMKTPEDWRTFFMLHAISFVVRSPDYPNSIRRPLEEMESTGELAPFAEIRVQNFRGMRLSESRENIAVVILRVRH
jgi:hypothetical protein